MAPHLPPTAAKWFDIWAAGVAVNTMCIQHGFTGIAVGLGKSTLIGSIQLLNRDGILLLARITG